jgi:hypothetical protein
VKAAALIAVGVLMAPPASACHRYSVWNYPNPQRCGTDRAAPRTRVYFAEVADDPMPPERSVEDDDPERARGLMLLREELDSLAQLSEQLQRHWVGQ